MAVKRKTGRLDIPGFSLGQKTDEYIDVARLFGGHGATRKSGLPHSAQELLGGQNLSQERKLAIYKALLGRQEYTRIRRIKARQKKQAITASPLAAYCLRRYLEHSGLKTHDCKFAEAPDLIIPEPRIIYEVTDGLLPLVSFTSAREASLLCTTYAHFGHATYFNQIETGITPGPALKYY